MTTLSELIGRCITPEAKDCNSPRIETLAAPIQAGSDKPHGLYEAAVFNFLLGNRELLGIKSVMKFTALIVDGAVELADGKRLTVEVKFRMNWAKACQAEWQFRTFLKRTDRKPFPVDGGLVIFEEFSGDWNKKADCRLLENGWSHWYRGHSGVEGYRVDLLRFWAGKLDAFPIVDAVMAKVESLTGAQAKRLLAGLE